MVPPPPILNGARVLRFALIDDAVEPTGRTVHRVADKALGPAVALAICQYGGQADFYLFYCDGDWNVVTDTWHQTMDSALKQAEFEYRGLSFS